ncbi:IS982 family transposase [Rickettsia endosymbiont of Rhinocyllus conicus]|uniref:IS982 family transposase n=1 Tax=Rickettsia endosymbiont of Rhinocyllus conicus TaxID=3066252 RepID=UPI00313348D2
MSPCKDFKNYYLYHLSCKYRGYFSLPSYSRIIQLWPRLVLPLTIMLQLFTGDETGIYFVDSTKLSICHAKRTNNNKVFSGIAKIGMSSYGWFMGFKLHIVINNKGQIMAIKITKGNASDLSAVDSITKGLWGKLFGDKAYISKEMSAKLFSRGLRLFTGIRKDMKNHLLDIEDKILLKSRSIIESVFNVLKNSMNLEHSRHRSPINFLVHILSCVNAFNFNKSKKFLTLLAYPQTSLS